MPAEPVAVATLPALLEPARLPAVRRAVRDSGPLRCATMHWCAATLLPLQDMSGLTDAVKRPLA